MNKVTRMRRIRSTLIMVGGTLMLLGGLLLLVIMHAVSGMD